MQRKTSSKFIFIKVSNDNLSDAFECYSQYCNEAPKDAPEAGKLQIFGTTLEKQRINFINYFFNNYPIYENSILDRNGSYAMWLIVDTSLETNRNIGIISLERDVDKLKDQLLEIDIFFIKKYQGKQLGRPIVNQFIEEIYKPIHDQTFKVSSIIFENDESDFDPNKSIEIKPQGISAKIKLNNIGSLATFIRCGFQSTGFVVTNENFKKVTMAYSKDISVDKEHEINVNLFHTSFNLFLEDPKSPTMRRKEKALEDYQNTIFKI